MATITYDKKELEKFIGKSRPMSEIVNAFEMLGMPVDKFNEESLAPEVTTDRVDMFTVEGAGRALAHFLEISNPKKYKFDMSKVKLHVDNVPARPIIAAFIAKDVDLDEEMLKALIMAQEKIHDTFGRKRKKVSIGIHDFDKIKGPLTYKPFKYIRFVPLDSKEEMDPQTILKKHPKGKEYKWIFEGIGRYPIVSDAEGVISFPPIINCERTRVTEKTRNLLFEITGTSEDAVVDILNVFAASLYDRGAKIENINRNIMQLQEVKSSLTFERIEKVPQEFINKTLGLKLKGEEIVELLGRMGHIAKVNSKEISISVPPYRTDIIHYVDFVEDVAVAYGYENFKPSLPGLSTIGRPSERGKRERKIRNRLTGAQFLEAVTWTLTNKEMNRAAMIEDEAATIKNPRTADFTQFRTSLLPSLLKTLAENKTRGFPQKIYEIGRTAKPSGECRTKLCCIVSDTKAPFSRIRGVLQLLEDGAGINIATKQEDKKFLIEGRSVKILSVRNKKEIGWCGEINPEVLVNFGLEYPAAAFEIYL